MNITMYSKNKKSLSFFKDAQNEYLKRLSRFSKVKSKSLSQLKFNEKEMFILVDLDNTELTSPDFSNYLSKWMSEGFSSFNFVLSSEESLKNQVDKQNVFTLSLSSVNLDEDMQITMLLEQIYRAFKISSGESYHK